MILQTQKYKSKDHLLSNGLLSYLGISNNIIWFIILKKIACNTIYQEFKSSQRLILFPIQICIAKTKIKKREAGNGPIFKQANIIDLGQK